MSLTEIFAKNKAHQKCGESWAHAEIMNHEHTSVVRNRYSFYLLSLIRYTFVIISVPVIAKSSTELTCSGKVCWMKQKS